MNQYNSTIEQLHEQDEKKDFPFFGDFVFDYYRHLYHILKMPNFGEFERDDFSAREISLGKAGLTTIAKSSENVRDIYPCTVRIPVPNDNTDIRVVAASLKIKPDGNSYIRETKISGRIFWEFDVMVKESGEGFDPRIERAAYDRLFELGIQTLTPVFPLHDLLHVGLSEKIIDRHFMITFIEKGLRPLSSIESERLFSEDQNSGSIIHEVFDVFAQMHGNYVVHGDPHLGNIGYKADGGLYILDPESFIDFSATNISFEATQTKQRKYEEDIYRSNWQKYRYLSVENPGFSRERIKELVWEEAVLNDFRRFLTDIERKLGNDLQSNYAESMQYELGNYLQNMKNTGHLTEQLTQRLQNLFNEYLS